MLEPLSPWIALSGGALIGAAASLLLLLTGRIAGVSGLVAAAATIADNAPWRPSAAFVIAIPAGAAFVSLFVRAPQLQLTPSIPLVVIAGLLVGFGTRLGNGCTSGHGVCGVSRMSLRSLAATATFMAAAIASVFVSRHVVGG